MRGKRNQERWQRNHENRFILFLLLTGLKSRTTSVAAGGGGYNIKAVLRPKQHFTDLETNFRLPKGGLAADNSEIVNLTYLAGNPRDCLSLLIRS